MEIVLDRRREVFQPKGAACSKARMWEGEMAHVGSGGSMPLVSEDGGRNRQEVRLEREKATGKL